MEYVTISPPFISSARPLSKKDKSLYFREAERLIQLFHRQNFSCGIFSSLGSANSAKENALSLYYHQLEQQNQNSAPTGFVAIFRNTELLQGPHHYKQLLESHLRKMHRHDNHYLNVKPYLIHSDETGKFEFSLGGRIYAITEYHPYNNDSRRYYDLVMLAFEAKYDGIRIFSPSAQCNSVREYKEKRKAAI